jgi:RNA polymerase sigma-70 factor (ECF subfamily)
MPSGPPDPSSADLGLRHSGLWRALWRALERSQGTGYQVAGGAPLASGAQGVEELELVAGLRARHEGAVRVLLERYRPLFFHCISNFESEASARDDLHQDIVLYVLERLDQGSFDPEKGSLGTWLYRVAWCRCVDIKRKAGARRTPKLTPVGDKIPDRPDAAPGPGELAGSEEIGLLVQRGMALLEEEDRRMLLLRFVDGHTLAEIGAELDLSLEQTKYRLRRATTSLRRVLLHDFAIEEAVG